MTRITNRGASCAHSLLVCRTLSPDRRAVFLVATYSISKYPILLGAGQPTFDLPVRILVVIVLHPFVNYTARVSAVAAANISSSDVSAVR